MGVIKVPPTLKTRAHPHGHTEEGFPDGYVARRLVNAGNGYYSAFPSREKPTPAKPVLKQEFPALQEFPT